MTEKECDDMDMKTYGLAELHTFCSHAAGLRFGAASITAVLVASWMKPATSLGPISQHFSPMRPTGNTGSGSIITPMPFPAGIPPAKFIPGAMPCIGGFCGGFGIPSPKFACPP